MLGLIEFTGYGFFFCLRKGQVVFSAEHIEIALGGRHHQVLFGGLVLRFSFCNLAVGLFQLNPAVIAKQWLDQLQVGSLIRRIAGFIVGGQIVRTQSADTGAQVQ